MWLLHICTFIFTRENEPKPPAQIGWLRRLRHRRCRGGLKLQPSRDSVDRRCSSPSVLRPKRPRNADSGLYVFSQFVDAVLLNRTNLSTSREALWQQTICSTTYSVVYCNNNLSRHDVSVAMTKLFAYKTASWPLGFHFVTLVHRWCWCLPTKREE